MTRPTILTGVLAAACVGTLLWCAWLIVAAGLPLGATIASWALWLMSVAAVVTLFAYLREFLRHRQAVGREASWKPLPGLVLLWIGGLTALASFTFMLPDRAPSNGAAADVNAGTSVGAQTVDATSASSVAATAAASATSAKRSKASPTTPPAPVSTAAPQGTAAAGGAQPSAASRPVSTSTSRPSTSTPSSTSSPLINITLHPTPPGR